MVSWLYSTHKSSQIHLPCSPTNRCTTASKEVACGLLKLSVTTTRNTGLRLQLICAIISLPTFLVIIIKQSKLLFIFKNSTIEETLYVPYLAQLFLSSSNSRFEIQYVSDLTSIRRNRSQMDSTIKSTAKALLQHTSQFKVNPEFTINLILVLIMAYYGHLLFSLPTDLPRRGGNSVV